LRSGKDLPTRPRPAARGASLLQLHSLGGLVMTEVITDYEDEIVGTDASVWSARVCGRPRKGKWEAWIEFVPLTAGHAPVRTPTETTQPDRESAVHWATVLSPTYLEGALARARERPTVVVTKTAPPLFDTPAAVVRTATVDGPRPDAILDPHAVFAQGGEALLVDQLSALDTQHLRDIVRAYDITSPETSAVASRGELTAHILTAARGRSAL
jgi:hypothetical protein